MRKKEDRKPSSRIWGILLLVAVGYAGIWCESFLKYLGKTHHWTLPNIEYVFWAIAIGLVVGIFARKCSWLFEILKPGILTYEIWLKFGIVILGTRFLIRDVLKLGGASLVLVAIELCISIFIMTRLGKFFGLGEKLTSLLAVGSAICGVSAIIATKGAIKAKDEDATLAATTILASGAISVFVFIVIGHLFHLSDRAFGMWAGLAVDNTAEAVATGVLFSVAAGTFATLAKTTRNAMIGPVVLGYAWYYARKGMAPEIENKRAFLWNQFPKFVLGFLAMSALASVGVFSHAALGDFATFSKWMFTLTFAGVGLRIDLREMRQKKNLRPFIVGFIGEVAIAAVTLVFILGGGALGLS